MAVRGARHERSGRSRPGAGERFAYFAPIALLAVLVAPCAVSQQRMTAVAPSIACPAGRVTTDHFDHEFDPVAVRRLART